MLRVLHPFFWLVLYAALLAPLSVYSQVAVASANEIVFGGDRAYPPFEWNDGGTPKGFNIELEQAIAAAAGLDAKHRLGDWPEIVRALEAGEVDAVPMFHSDDRAKQFNFVPAFYQVHHAIYGKENSDSVASLNELTGRSLAVEELSYAHQQLDAEGTGARLIFVANTKEALEAVANGDAEYALLASITASHLIRSARLPVKRVGPPLWPRSYAFAVRKTRPDLAERIAHGLDQVIASGQYQMIYERWEDQVAPTGTDLAMILRTALLMAAPVVFVGGIGWIWSWSLRRTVALRTGQLAEELRLRIEAQDRIHHLASHDASTGLPNLERFLELASSALDPRGSAEGQKEIVTLRLSETGSIVRTFGYAVSQQLIAKVATRLKELDFQSCAYLGRGVFAILADRHVVRKRINLLAYDLDVNGLSLNPQTMTGVAVYPVHSRKVEDLVRYAETALAVGAARKQPWTEYEPSMEPDRMDLQLIADFRQSQHRQLYAVFQPQIALSSGEIVAAEALVRWVHPQFGLVPPSRFVPLLENAGLIPKVTRYMLSEAARVAGALRCQGTPCCISVNVTASDLLDGHVMALIRGMIERNELRPSDLKLELTETSVAVHPEQISKIFSELSNAGIRGSVDDFGTGYSSLSHLSAFPVHEVKIDRSFVSNMLRNSRNHSIVRSTISLGHALGLTVVAEGVEDQETLATLRDDGCDRVQGYVVSKPLLEADFLTLLEEQRHRVPNNIAS